ncbi:RWP-RK domain-containing protein [Artemisia annua]|uniref:RWP-RK domain-containing protein n=1 Tax=Artemisia annua TaxID=35608 RepID=A0A2U1M8S3_ARTAN|nr:RWP-RK domain-containing protein [Artemisia annua]
MDEANAILPYNEPFEHRLQEYEHFLMHDENDTEIPSTSQQIDPLMGDDDPFLDDSFILDNDLFDEGNLQTNTTPVNDEPNIGSSEFGNPIHLSSWPLQVPPYTCSCCQILREISHTNSVDITKLEIHGRLGVISHAILEKYSVDLTTNQTHEYKMFDFCKESIVRVKEFLVEYCNERKTNGYIMLQDPFSSFYEAVCVGLDWVDNTVTDDLIPDPFPDDSGEHQMIQISDVETSGARSLNRSTLSIQRERTGKLTMKDLTAYFHIPIEAAAKKVHFCPTVIKKVCRKHGLSRWPYRKICSIEKKISKKARYLTSVNVEERGRAQAEIDTLRQEIANFYSRYNA